jgi:uncharacterized protein YqhQ
LVHEEPTVGGQAVIEGVMMKSPDRVATCVRKPGGEIVHRVEPYVSLTKRHRMLDIPVIRGALNLFEQLYLGISALTYSAEVASAEEGKEVKGQRGWKGPFTAGLTVVLALGAGLLLFFYLPLVIAGLAGAKGDISFNVVDGLVRLGIFFAYLAVINLWKDMRRVFQYHGAEHKSINALESGVELSVEAVKKHTTRHARCGTSFLLVVMVLSIIVFIFMGRPENLADRLRRLIAVPLIAGLSYELIKLAGRRKSGILMKVMTAPGLALQRFTTREPDDGQIEVALEALKHALGLKEDSYDAGSDQQGS